MDAGAYEQSSVCHDGRLFVTHIHSQSSAGDLITINIQRKLIELVMAEVVGVRVYAAQKV
jgi:hypothetical protein